jgi:selenide,water dikinase
MEQNWPLIQDLVLVGGGHAHALVLRAWAMDPLPGVRLTLITPEPVAPYTGMLPGLIAGHYRRDEIMVDLVRLARAAGARLILAKAEGLDLERREVILADRRIPADLLSLDIGSRSDLGLPGFADHVHAAKPLGDYAQAWELFAARPGARPGARVVVVGGGLGGVELALASAHRLPQVQVTLVGRPEAALRGALARAGVDLVEGRARGAEAGAVLLEDGRALASDFTLCVTGARPQGWLAETGLRLEDGFLALDPFLRTSAPWIFAAGDCARLATPRPKAGVFAVRAAPILHHNLRATILGKPLRPFRPQGDYLRLVALGDKRALAQKWGLAAQGALFWRWKDRIDRRFMAMLGDLPAMAAPAIPAVPGLAEAMGPKPLCGGCGGKVGAGALSALRAALPPPRRAEVLAGAGDDAAVLKVVGGVQVISTDHLRAFCLDPALMGRLAALHALGDIWAMGATPQVALAQITLPRASEAMQARLLTEVMSGAATAFAEAGADIVGGHTAQGAELTLGFTVTGVALRPLAKGGAQVGDRLILTKPLGIGVILAAEMARAKIPGALLGEAVAGAWAAMGQGNGPASAILARHAHAMTDVTGFGLAGHLLEMLEASGLAARIDLAALPALEGALALLAAGEGSSIEPANRALALGRLRGADLTQPRARLLFDPQTCGGLLAAVPPSLAGRLLAELGPGAVEIGEILPGPPEIRL